MFVVANYSTGRGFSLEVGLTNERPRFLFAFNGSDSRDIDITGDANIPIGVNTVITVTSDGTNGALYINGRLAGTDTGAPVTPNNNLEIGRYSGNAFYWNGTIDDVCLWNRVLSPAEIYEIVQNPVAWNRKTLNYLRIPFTPSVSGVPEELLFRDSRFSSVPRGAASLTAARTALRQPFHLENDPVSAGEELFRDLRFSAPTFRASLSRAHLLATLASQFHSFEPVPFRGPSPYRPARVEAASSFRTRMPQTESYRGRPEQSHESRGRPEEAT
jgi:hypothetical protein